MALSLQPPEIEHEDAARRCPAEQFASNAVRTPPAIAARDQFSLGPFGSVRNLAIDGGRRATHIFSESWCVRLCATDSVVHAPDTRGPKTHFEAAGHVVVESHEPSVLNW